MLAAVAVAAGSTAASSAGSILSGALMVLTIFFGIIFTLLLAAFIVLIWAIRKYGGKYIPNLFRTWFARQGWFWAFVGEMTAVVVEKFGKFHRCYMSVNLLRYAEFRGWADQRNLQYLADNKLLKKNEPRNWKKLEDRRRVLERRLDSKEIPRDSADYKKFDKEYAKFAEEALKAHESECPFILLHAEMVKDKPVLIGLPWEVKIRTILEVEGEEVGAASLERGFAVTVDLNQRAIFVPKQKAAEKAEEAENKRVVAAFEAAKARGENPDPPKLKEAIFYMPDVPSRDGVNTAASLSVIVRPHDVYKLIYNLKFWKLTLLNEIVPLVREAIADGSWYEIAQQLAGAGTTVDPRALKESILKRLNPQIRLLLGVEREESVTGEDGQPILDEENKPRTKSVPNNIEWHDGRRIERYRDNDITTLGRVYGQYGLYVVDVKVQDVEPDQEFLVKIAAITGAKFGAQAEIEKAQGDAVATRTRGQAEADVVRMRQEELAKGVKAMALEGVDPTRAAELFAQVESFKNVKEANVVAGADSVLGGIVGARRAWESGTSKPKSPNGDKKPARGSSTPKPMEGGTEGTKGGESK